MNERALGLEMLEHFLASIGCSGLIRDGVLNRGSSYCRIRGVPVVQV